MEYIVILLWAGLGIIFILHDKYKHKDIQSNRDAYECLACGSSIDELDRGNISCPDCKCTKGPESKKWCAKKTSNF